MGLDFAFDVLRNDILYSKGGLSVVTTGTSEEILKTVTIPAGVFSSGIYSGVQIQASFKATGASNSKTVKGRIGGIAGTAFWSQAQTTNSIRWWLQAQYMVQTTDLLCGYGQQTIDTGTSAGNLYSLTDTSVTFANPIDIVFTGTSTVAGELGLTAVRVVLLRAVG